jgi:hypothetical protein
MRQTNLCDEEIDSLRFIHWKRVVLRFSSCTAHCNIFRFFPAVFHAPRLGRDSVHGTASGGTFKCYLHFTFWYDACYVIERLSDVILTIHRLIKLFASLFADFVHSNIGCWAHIARNGSRGTFVCRSPSGLFDP